MTEDDAKAKWCAFARVGVTDSNGPNRFASGAGEAALQTVAPSTLCIASACMAWRWVRAFEGPFEKAWDRKTGEPRPAPLTDHGFCGLAGQPS